VCPSNLRIGHDNEEDREKLEEEEGDVEMEPFPEEAKTGGPGPGSFSPPEPEPSGKIGKFFAVSEEVIEVSSGVGRAFDGSYSGVCESG